MDQKKKSKKHISNIKNIKVAYRLVFFGLEACITCALIYPLMNMALKYNLINIVEPKIIDSKSYYKSYVTNIVQKYTNEYTNSLPVPILLVQLKPEEPLKLVSPPVVTEIAMSLSDKLDSLEKMAFIDGESTINVFFINLLHKMTSSLVEQIEAFDYEF